MVQVGGIRAVRATTEQLANLRTVELALGDATKNKLAAAAASSTAALAVQAAGTKPTARIGQLSQIWRLTPTAT